MNKDLITKKAHQFLDKVFKCLDLNRIDLGNWQIDHLCYRTSSVKNYEDSKRVFEKLGELLIESEVNGRLISTYKLFAPIEYKQYRIDLVEVPAPKAGKVTQEGFEHIEAVIDISFEELFKLYSHLTFVTKGMSKELNPEVEIEFDDCAIKFHHQSLEDVIKIEKGFL